MYRYQSRGKIRSSEVKEHVTEVEGEQYIIQRQVIDIEYCEVIRKSNRDICVSVTWNPALSVK